MPVCLQTPGESLRIQSKTERARLQNRVQLTIGRFCSAGLKKRSGGNLAGIIGLLSTSGIIFRSNTVPSDYNCWRMLVHDDDALIMRRVQAGDLERFSELIRRYQRPLLRAAFERLGERDWAEDVVQETFLAAFAG